MTSIDDARQKTAVFQWNVNGLCGRLSNVRQFVFKYRFPNIPISESHICDNSWLSEYEIFRSNNGTVHGRGLISVRKDLTYNSHNFATHTGNEYVALTVTTQGSAFAIFPSYISLRASFHVQPLKSILQRTPSHNVLTGNFSSHDTCWGSACTSPCERDILNRMTENNLSIINYGGATFYRHRGNNLGQ